MKKFSFLLISLFIIVQTSLAQVKIGNNPNVINTASLLELESTDKGVLIPKIALNNTSLWTLTGTPIEGMLIYNETGSAAKGFYYWNGTVWLRISNDENIEWQNATISGVNSILAKQAAATGDTVVITDNGHVGIGTPNPISKLDIRSAGNNTSTQSINIQNTSGENIISTYDNGSVKAVGGMFNPIAQGHYSGIVVPKQEDFVVSTANKITKIVFPMTMVSMSGSMVLNAGRTDDRSNLFHVDFYIAGNSPATTSAGLKFRKHGSTNSSTFDKYPSEEGRFATDVSGNIILLIGNDSDPANGFLRTYINNVVVGNNPELFIQTPIQITYHPSLAAASAGLTIHKTLSPPIIVPTTHNTLDQAYDEGGIGLGRTITADAGAVQIVGNGGLNIGNNNTLTGNMSLVVGTSNRVLTDNSSVTGGLFNRAEGATSGVSSGRQNKALGDNSVVSGGILNTAHLNMSAVSGGLGNEALGVFSSVGGGSSNKARGSGARIGGGSDNHTFGNSSVIPGGQGLVTTAFGETVVGINNDTTNGFNHNKTSRVLTDPLFVIGNGSDNTTGRSTALTILKNGNATLAGTLTQLSDKRLKNNITPLRNSLNNLQQLNGYTYNWKNVMNKDTRTQVGLIAQEVQALYPELITTTEKGILGINYIGLVPVLIEATKEQQHIIETQQAALEITQKRLDRLEKEFQALHSLLSKK